jgi:hypothetical protein
MSSSPSSFDGVMTSGTGMARPVRRSRADSIPEDRETTATLTSSSIGDASSSPPAATTPMELLFRHSSPLVLRSGRAATSPLTERNSSPSPLRLNRPRSNPRNRTPMRAQEGEDGEEETQIPTGSQRQEQRRVAGRETFLGGLHINIRPSAGRAVGAAVPGCRVSCMTLGFVLCAISFLDHMSSSDACRFSHFVFSNFVLDDHSVDSWRIFEENGGGCWRRQKSKTGSLSSQGPPLEQ